MLTLNDGRSELWQWDTGRTLAVDADCSQVHFSNKVFGRSIDVDVVGGAAIIPDVMLQTDNDLNVWAFVGAAENGYTKISKTFKVNRRNKPSDYVFTPTEQMTLQMIQRQIGDLADLTTEAKDTMVAAINEAARTDGGAGSMDLRVADGYIQYSRDGGMTWTNLIAMADLKGADGKSAYQYAVDAGYTGYEAAFAERMAAEIPTVDSTLTQSGQAADAAVVGNRLSALSEEIVTTAESKVAEHNTGTDTHSDIRLLIQGLTDRLNALADSDDNTLDQLSEIVAYIKSNRDLISSITTDKVSVADIVDNLTTNVANKPLSAAQGVAIKALIDALTEAMPEAYSLPIASSTVLGGVNPVAKTEVMTKSVGVDEAGALWTEPGSAGSAVSTLKKVWSVDVTEPIADLHQTINFAGPVRRIVIICKALEGSTSSESRAGITFKQSGLADAETLNIKGVVGASGTPIYFSAVFDVFAGGYVCEFLANKSSVFHTWNHLVTNHYYYVNPDRMAEWDAILFNVWHVSSGSIEIWADAEVLE